MTWEEAVDEGLKGRGVFLKPEVIAEGMGVTPQTVCSLLRRGELRGTKVGKGWYVSRDWLMRHLGIE